jgi:hypothetical protein
MVLRKAWEAFTSHSCNVLRRVVSSEASGGQEHFTAQQELLALASCIAIVDPEDVLRQFSAAFGEVNRERFKSLVCSLCSGVLGISGLHTESIKACSRGTYDEQLVH